MADTLAAAASKVASRIPVATAADFSADRISEAIAADFDPADEPLRVLRCRPRARVTWRGGTIGCVPSCAEEDDGSLASRLRGRRVFHSRPAAPVDRRNDGYSCVSTTDTAYLAGHWPSSPPPRPHPPAQLTDIALRVRVIVAGDRHVRLDDGNIVDLLADSIPHVSLDRPALRARDRRVRAALPRATLRRGLRVPA